MYLTRTIQIHEHHSSYKELDDLLFLSKNLYNVCLYEERQLFFKKRDCKEPLEKEKLKSFIANFELSTKLCNDKNPDYKALPAVVAQQICKQVYLEYKSFFSKFKNDKTARIPKYKHKTKGRNKVLFPFSNGVSKPLIQKGIIKLFKIESTFKLPKGIDYKDIKQIEITKEFNTIKIIICYKVPDIKLKNSNNRTLGIDIGLNNLLSVVSNFKGFKPILYDGKYLKSLNQFYNKESSHLKSLNKNLSSKKLKSLSKNRMNRIDDYLHKVSKDLINQAVSNDVTSIVICKNLNWKQEMKLGKVNNQNFVQIPFNKIISMIKYKANLKGIDVIEIEESYTSKCSFFDNEYPCEHENYQGRRIHRGLFKTSLGKTLNADLNGALNIIKKVIPDFSCETANLGVEDMANPVRMTFKQLNARSLQTIKL